MNHINRVRGLIDLANKIERGDVDHQERMKRVRETHYQRPALSPEIQEHAVNLRRNIRHAQAELSPGNDRDSRLIDYLNHMDTIAQQIERAAGGGE